MTRTKTTTQDRRSRYIAIMHAICEQDSFMSEEVQQRCEGENLTFIKRVLNQLHRDGTLFVSEELGGHRYRWIEGRKGFDPVAWVESQLCGNQITQTPEEERPRERLLRIGAEKLRTAELIAILIRSGRTGESALQGGEKVANRIGDQLDRLRQLSPGELKQISRVVSDTAYCQIMAGIELGRRVSQAIDKKKEKPKRIESSAAAIEYCTHEFSRLAHDRTQEEFHIVTLDTKLQPIAHHQVTVGTLDASLVAPREVFRPAIRDAAAAVLLVHNHPSGDPTPSRQDFQVTERLDEAAKIIGIQVIDHIVVAARGAVSLRDLS